MAANPINQLASVSGLAFPPGVVYPDPTLGTLQTAEELEQAGYAFALEVSVAAPPVPPVPTVAAARPDSYLWQVPRGSRRAYVHGWSTLLQLWSQGRARYSGRESAAGGISVLPLPGSVGKVREVSYSTLEVPVSIAVGYAETEGEVVASLVMTYLAGRI